MTTGEKISKLRKEKNLTQEQFAELMNVSRQSVSKWEQDLAYPETEKLIKLCSLLQCSIDYILREEVSDPAGIGESTRRYRSAGAFRGDGLTADVGKAPIKRKNTMPKEFEGIQPLLELSGISKHYMNDEKVQTVLQGITLSFYEGEFVAITGESGCGKTTLMNLISGEKNYDDGTISYKGRNYEDFTARQWKEYGTKELGYVAQDNKLLMNYTVEQNVLSPLLIKGEDLEQCRAKVLEILETVGLLEFRGQRIVNLSAGQRQRVAIARILAKDTKVILADEITANLDGDTAGMIMEILRKISKDRLILMITHTFPQAREYVTRHVNLCDGRVDVDELLGQQQIAETAVPEESGDDGKHEAVSNIGIFVRWNLESARTLGVLVTLFFFFMGIVTFALGNLYFANADNITIKKFDKSAFINEDARRVVVMRKDGGEISEEEFQQLLHLKKVVDGEYFDLINDINYFYREEEDFKFEYSGSGRSFVPFEKNQFMRSVSALGTQKLLDGRLPETASEVVVSREDAGLLGQTIPFYFIFKDYARTFCCRELTVVGVARGEGHQVFFSMEESRMFSELAKNSSCVLHFDYMEDADLFSEDSSVIPLINDDIPKGEVCFSREYVMMLPHSWPYGKSEIAKMEFSGLVEQGQREKFRLPVHSWYQLSDLDPNWTYREHYKVFEGNYSSFPFALVNSATFYQLYDGVNKQMTLFAEDYLDVDAVIKQLEKTGEYAGYSSYRISMNQVDAQKKSNRARIYGMITAAAAMVLIATVFLASALMCQRREDYAVLKHLGMNKRERRRVLVRQFGLYSLLAFGLYTMAVLLVKVMDPTALHDYLKYFRLPQYLITTVLYILLLGLSGWATCVRMQKRRKGEEKA